MTKLRFGLIALACAALACNTLTPGGQPTAPPQPTEQQQVDTPAPDDATPTAAAPTDEAAPTEVPTAELATEAPTAEGPAPDLRLVVLSPSKTEALYDLDGNEYPPTEAQETLYVFTAGFNTDPIELGHAYAISPDAVTKLDFVQDAFQSLAVFGTSDADTTLAWATYSDDPNGGGLISAIHVSGADGSDSHVAFSETSSTSVLRVWRWSANGDELYFSKEPLGLGGYILFPGITNIWGLSLHDGGGDAREIVPNMGQGIICIDDLSADETVVTDHCLQGPIAGVETVGQGPVTAVAAPFETLVSASLAGDVRLSPDGSRVAFAVAAGVPDNEQGWVAVSDGLGVTSHLVATSDPGEFFHVLRWLDNDTLLLESEGVVPGIYRAAADGSGAVRIADGRLLGVIDNLPGQP